MYWTGPSVTAKPGLKVCCKKINAKGNSVIVPTPITLESTTEEGSVLIVGNEDEGEEELPSGMSASVSGGTPNKKRKKTDLYLDARAVHERHDKLDGFDDRYTI